eukprot:14236208-Alexandrium_andersonii.AAC.1
MAPWRRDETKQPAARPVLTAMRLGAPASQPPSASSPHRTARDEGRGRAATGRALRLPTNPEPLAPRPGGGWTVLLGG